MNEEAQRENEALKAAQVRSQAEVDRLRAHLLSTEDSYTQELLKCQQKEKQLRESLVATEDKLAEQWRTSDKLKHYQEQYSQVQFLASPCLTYLSRFVTSLAFHIGL